MPDTLRWSAMDEHQRDALIAEKIFGYTVAQPWGPNGLYAVTKDSSPEPESSWRDCPRYTTSMDAAWLVVERITKPPTTTAEPLHSASSRFAAWFDTANLWACSAQEAAEMICKKALKCVGVDIEE